MADEFRRGLDRIGKGGVHCTCCNFYHGREKAKLRRIVRARLKQRAQRRIESEAYKETN